MVHPQKCVPVSRLVDTELRLDYGFNTRLQHQVLTQRFGPVLPRLTIDFDQVVSVEQIKGTPPESDNTLLH